VQIGAISALGSTAPGIDTVTNTVAFSNGIDAETDAALKARFANFINTRDKGTEAAVEYAVQSLQQGLTYSVAENVDTQGNYRPGNFVVTIDNGTGAPPSGLLSQVYAAIDAVRPIGSTFAVQAPTVVTANIGLTITAAAGYTKANLIGPVASAIEAYVDELGMANALAYFSLAQVPFSVAGVAKIEGLTVNSGTADIGGAAGTVVRAGTVTVA
jgi:phage-related baseplate assembly protein